MCVCGLSFVVRIKFLGVSSLQYGGIWYEGGRGFIENSLGGILDG